MYNHYDTNEENIILHDCTAQKVKIKKDNLIFYFNDGFWICAEHENNKLNETVRTDKSKVKYKWYYCLCFSPKEKKVYSKKMECRQAFKKNKQQ